MKMKTLLADLLHEMRKGNVLCHRSIELHEQQRAANRQTEQMRAAEHIEVMANLERRKVIDALDLESLQRRVENERRWDKKDRVDGIAAALAEAKP